MQAVIDSQFNGFNMQLGEAFGQLTDAWVTERTKTDQALAQMLPLAFVHINVVNLQLAYAFQQAFHTNTSQQVQTIAKGAHSSH